MFIDKAKITVKAGRGGDGSVSFWREKFIDHGGPDGGDGGNGGSIILVADKGLTNLIDFHFKSKYFAEDGLKGSGKKCYGKAGKNLVIKVPRGTVVRDVASGKVIADMFYDGETKILCHGGKGGRGNAKFATATRQAPHFSQMGENTKTYEIQLELKTIADVGLVGFPNVGKSTLLSQITSAKPKIANYHFTTLSPNLGVVNFYENNFVVADIPGLIEGASDGAGLGHDFLKHIERTRLILHVIDFSESEERNAIEDYKTINNELATYSTTLAELPQIIALNKCDMIDNVSEKVESFKKAVKNPLVFPISAITKDGLDELLKATYAKLQTLPEPEPVPIEEYNFDERDTTSVKIERLPDASFVVSGGLIDEIARGIVFDNTESVAYFQKRLKNDGIIDMLKEKGATEGSTIRFGDRIFEFLD